MSIYRKYHVISWYVPLIWLAEDGYKRADFGRPRSSLFVNSFSGLRYYLWFSLWSKQSGASITWKELSFPDGTTLPKLCLMAILARRMVKSAVISPLELPMAGQQLESSDRKLSHLTCFWLTLVALSGLTLDSRSSERNSASGLP